jgi:hypothetical protein
MYNAININNTKLNIIFLLILTCLIIEVSLNKISSDIPNYVNSQIGMAVFITISLTGLAGLYYFYNITSKNDTLNYRFKELPLKSKDHKIIGLITYSLIIVNVLIIIQVIFLFYNILLLNILILISYGSSFILFILVAIKFLKWFKIKKNILFLLYGLSMIFIASSIFAFSFYQEARLADKIMTFGSNTNILNTKVENNSELNIRSNFSSPHISSHILFNDTLLHQAEPSIQAIGFMKKTVNDESINIYIFLLWIATIVLLIPSIKKIGRIKYLLIICVPLIYYIFTYNIFSYLDPKTSYGTIPDIIYNGISATCGTNTNNCFMELVASVSSTLVETYSVFIMGLFIYLGLNAISKTITKDHPIKGYLKLSSIGFILFFINNESSIANTAFPPFGIINTSFLLISSYMFITGISISAFIIANDHELRREIKKSTINTLKFVEEMGDAEDSLNLEKKVQAALKNKKKLSTSEDIEVTVTDFEISKYIEEIVKEIHDKNK